MKRMNFSKLRARYGRRFGQAPPMKRYRGMTIRLKKDASGYRVFVYDARGHLAQEEHDPTYSEGVKRGIRLIDAMLGD